MTDSRSTELLELAKRCEDRALYNTSGDPMRLLKKAADVMRRHARANHGRDAGGIVNGLKSLSGLRILTPEQSDFLYDAAAEIERLREIAKSPPSRQENDDVFPGFRGNNDGG